MTRKKAWKIQEKYQKIKFWLSELEIHQENHKSEQDKVQSAPKIQWTKDTSRKNGPKMNQKLQKQT